MVDMIVEVIAEVPDVDGNDEFCFPVPLNYLSAICYAPLYLEVDLKPLAVNLAKLSLWLNCFATHHRLTFIDHHLRCGNSLIGIHSLKELASIPNRKKDGQKTKHKQNLLFDYTDLSKSLTEAAKGIALIPLVNDGDTDTRKHIGLGTRIYVDMVLWRPHTVI